MKVKYANIDLDAEIDRWLGVLAYRSVLDALYAVKEVQD